MRIKLIDLAPTDAPTDSNDIFAGREFRVVEVDLEFPCGLMSDLPDQLPADGYEVVVPPPFD